MLDLLGYDKSETTLDRIREFEPPDGYYLAFSGGKDSIVLKHLTDMARVKYDAHMSLTTVDTPEVLKYVKEHHPDIILERPKKTMWQLILYNHMPPTRLARYCCRELKETGGIGRLVLTGIRAEESHARSKRQMVEQCRADPRKRYLHPIIDWTEQEIWQFIRDHALPYCSLYDEGFKRIGCVMCPMGTKKQREYEIKRFPKFYKAYMRTFEKLVATGKTNWTSADDVMKWWLSSSSSKEYDDQGMFE